ncbi:MAG TPA: hypothetical protein VNI20_12785, partial [Fimbriimonadaceae bacterium]|nr:hypothetical protein [Fimbriimonadaceae bacterium]
LDPMVGTDEDKGLPMNELWHFHYPLTLATMTMILSMPLISAALARSPDSVRMLAAWGLAQGTMFLFRSVTFALPETVVALYRDTETRVRLSEFCTRVGIVCGVAVLLAYFSGAANWFFLVVLDGKPEIVVLSALALLVTVLVPVVNARGALFRGLLAAHRETKIRLYAIIVAIVSLALTLSLGVSLRLDGIVVAGFGMTIQVAAELIVLSGFWKRSRNIRALA